MILFRPAPGVAVVPFFGAPFFFGVGFNSIFFEFFFFWFAFLFSSFGSCSVFTVVFCFLFLELHVFRQWFDTGFGFTRLRVLCLGSVQADGGVGDNLGSGLTGSGVVVCCFCFLRIGGCFFLAADPTVVLEWCSKWGFRGCGRGDRR
ncbi:unnamed protein product [Trifolium pratense]|uniref:Uncharacterized protein n=1 Tax=Trifolium pratense TaxID=57577 RepID=A0ACB0KG50_TRIPR|nr:unnamed protein product [Trifolium pratense]